MYFSITPKIASSLMRIEAAAREVQALPVRAEVLAGLQETAKLKSTHYSTQIEGNRLTQEEVKEVVEEGHHIAGRNRDEGEVKGYYAALEVLEQELAKGTAVSEKLIQKLHALVMDKGNKRVSLTPYRDGQNMIRDAGTHQIVYLPPEAKDVSSLMRALVAWICRKQDLPCPVIAAIAHYQFATIHPYYDGNGRTARLLTTYILHAGGYGLQGVYALEEYYAVNLPGYYEALSIGPSHNYYMGRAEADITPWLEYFIGGMVASFEAVKKQAKGNKGKGDHSLLLKRLDPKQRKALVLFRGKEVITAQDVGELFGFAPRTARALCKKWADGGFLEVADPSKKGRKYRLANPFLELMEDVP